MSNFPESFDSLELLASFIGSLDVEELNEFIRGKYDISGIFEGRWFSGFAQFDDNLRKVIHISDKNTGGIELTDTTTGVKIWLDYFDLACALTQNYPLRLKYDTNCRSFPRIGFYTPKFSEVLLSWRTSEFDQDEKVRLPDRILEFSVNDIQVAVGLYTPMWALLIGGMFGLGGFPCRDFSSTFDDEIEHRTWTCKLRGDIPEDIEHILAQLLYYFNSKIKTGGDKASIGAIVYDYEYSDFEPTTPIPKIQRKVFSLRNESNPFLLFQSANDFLGYYRVLEYFFLRARSKEIEQIRWNNHLSADEFITAVEKIYRKTELKSLEMLVRQVADETIVENAIKSGLIPNGNADALARNIYERRNSLVHAKETEESFIPSVFPYYDSIEKTWTKIIRLLAINAIEKYCQ